MEKLTVGEQIRKARKKKKITQSELVEMAGLSARVISDIERTDKANLRTLKKIAEVLKTNLVIWK